MQKWEYLQLQGCGEWPKYAWIDPTGRTWLYSSTRVNVDADFARTYLKDTKAPYYAKFSLPQEVLDELGSEGWQLVVYDGGHGELIFQRPKE